MSKLDHQFRKDLATLWSTYARPPLKWKGKPGLPSRWPKRDAVWAWQPALPYAPMSSPWPSLLPFSLHLLHANESPDPPHAIFEKYRLFGGPILLYRIINIILTRSKLALSRMSGRGAKDGSTPFPKFKCRPYYASPRLSPMSLQAWQISQTSYHDLKTFWSNAVQHANFLLEHCKHQFENVFESVNGWGIKMCTY